MTLYRRAAKPKHKDAYYESFKLFAMRQMAYFFMSTSRIAKKTEAA